MCNIWVGALWICINTLNEFVLVYKINILRNMQNTFVVDLA